MESIQKDGRYSSICINKGCACPNYWMAFERETHSFCSVVFGRKRPHLCSRPACWLLSASSANAREASSFRKPSPASSMPSRGGNQVSGVT